jgi:cell wall-associated NlpC family hydrolase
MLLFSFFTVFASEGGYVNCNLLNVRVSPNTSSEIVAQLPQGTKLEIIYTDLGWYNVRMENGVTGFVFAPYITKAQIISDVNNEVAEKVASDAHNYIGSRYVYGTSGPNTFDCSGFTSYLYKQYGVSLPRTSTSQGTVGRYVDKNSLVEGDIVCFSNRSDRKINHVGIYVGDGNFIHASTSVRGVVMDSLYSNYYVNHYVTARRVM